MEKLIKKNLRQFLFEKGTIIANPDDVDISEGGSDEGKKFVIYFEGAVVVENRDDLKYFYDKNEKDVLYLVDEKDL